MLAAPSPKFVTVTRFSPFTCASSASPHPIGIPEPTTPVVTMHPLAGCVTCIGPPLPLQVPVLRPTIYAKIKLNNKIIKIIK